MELNSVEQKDLLANIIKIIALRNTIQSERQRTRSKKNYYKAIVAGMRVPIMSDYKPKGMVRCGRVERTYSNTIHKYDVYRPAKWVYPHAISDLRVIVKKLELEQLKTEIQLAELTQHTTRLMRDASKIIGAVQVSDTGMNRVRGLRIDGSYFGMAELERFVEDLEFENIILGAEHDI